MSSLRQSDQPIAGLFDIVKDGVLAIDLGIDLILSARSVLDRFLNHDCRLPVSSLQHRQDNALDQVIEFRCHDENIRLAQIDKGASYCQHMGVIEVRSRRPGIPR